LAEKNRYDKKVKAPSTQQFIPIKEVKEGVVVMRNGSLRAVLLVSSINFALKGEDEKNSIISSYQSFLNSLGFPIQVYVKSRQLHLDVYLASLEKQLSLQTNELLKLQTSQYIDFIAELLEYSNIMEKRFFIIVPFYPTGTEKVGVLKNLFSGKEGVADVNFETQKMELMQRVDHIINGLTGIGVRTAALNTEELIELYYSVYNPDISGSEKLTDISGIESDMVTTGGPDQETGTGAKNA
jgi:type IV secretory pathway VirB4 component